MRIDRGAGCGAAPRRLPGRRSRPPPPFFPWPPPPAKPAPRTPGGQRGRGTPDSPSPITTPSYAHPEPPRVPPTRLAEPRSWGLSPRVSPVWGPQSTQGTPAGTRSSAVPRGAAGLGFAPGAAPGALCELPKVSSCRQGNLFGRAVKKKKKAAHMHSSRHSPAHRFPAPGRDARVSAAHLPQPETDLFFIFQGPEHREPAGHLSISPRRGALGDATKISRAGSRLCPRAGAERALLSHTAPLISGRRSRGGCPGAQQRPGSLGGWGGFSLRAGSSCCVPHGWPFPGTPSPRRI